MEAESNRGPRGLTRGYPCARTNRRTNTRRDPEDRSRTPERAAASRNAENGGLCYGIGRLMRRGIGFILIRSRYFSLNVRRSGRNFEQSIFIV